MRNESRTRPVRVTTCAGAGRRARVTTSPDHAEGLFRRRWAAKLEAEAAELVREAARLHAEAEAAFARAARRA
jgi:hypothetical protein